ncbi:MULTISPECIES: helix-turn-helix domain-containing protein [Citromicrobium]|uniref:helix-turn-helix domain-containing protein n=1 Tax=Citromicrobium TaxID=72173 RepID=UPI0012FD42E3|nr:MULTISPECIES: helix-turn-helix transcriptional regulator [Citromicrobium]
MATLAREFGNGVRVRRKARGLTQAKLGEAAGLSEEWLRRIERGAGTPSFDAIEALSEALGCSAGDLFTVPSTRDQNLTRIDAMLADLPIDDLAWVEELLSVALRGRGE